jgi:hypothetical protein
VDYRARIRSIANDRGINDLLHFTQAANLTGIVRHGLLPRRELVKPIYSAYASDQYRLDGNNDVVSVSISRVNEAMFASKRDKSRHANWIILVLSPEILWTHSCRFCWCSAARNEIKNHRGKRDGPWAFAEMFAGSAETRDCLPPMYPTDPEAEVQVMECIAPHYIRGAVVNQSGIVEPVRRILGELFDGSPPVVVHDY